MGASKLRVRSYLSSTLVLSTCRPVPSWLRGYYVDLTYVDIHVDLDLDLVVPTRNTCTVCSHLYISIFNMLS